MSHFVLYDIYSRCKVTVSSRPDAFHRFFISRKAFDLRNLRFEKHILSYQKAFFLPVVFVQTVSGRKAHRNTGNLPSLLIRHPDQLILITEKICHIGCLPEYFEKFILSALRCGPQSRTVPSCSVRPSSWLQSHRESVPSWMRHPRPVLPQYRPFRLCRYP